MRIFNLILILALVSGCKHLPTNSGHSATTLADKTAVGSRAGAAITRQEVLQIAEAYARYEWRATVTNIFHGTDASGVRIDTPDVKWWGHGGWYSDGRVNVGVAYCWGGDSTLREFDEGILAGRPAGYDFRVSASADWHSVPASSLPVGVDCSGFVSRCWRLKIKRSTRGLIEDCRQLPSFDDLRPGDALNKPGLHVILFNEWLDEKHDKMRVVEAGTGKEDDVKEHPEYCEKVHENVYERTWLSTNGFVPLRYRGIVEQ
jgi:hypothetical protein